METLYVVAVLLDGEQDWKIRRISALVFSKDEDGKYSNDKEPEIFLDGPGKETFLLSTEDKAAQSMIRTFASFDSNDIAFVVEGIMMTNYNLGNWN